MLGELFLISRQDQQTNLYKTDPHAVLKNFSTHAGFCMAGSEKVRPKYHAYYFS